MTCSALGCNAKATVVLTRKTRHGHVESATELCRKHSDAYTGVREL